MRAHEAPLKNWHPSVIETLPNEYPELKMEFSKLESQMFDKPMRRAHEPLTPVIADANDRYALQMSIIGSFNSTSNTLSTNAL